MIAFRPILVFVLLLLPGCSSISKGIAEAVLEQKVEDTRECHITGKPFTGLRDSIESQGDPTRPHTTKMLMVHGISRHVPGYSERLRTRLAAALDLDSIQQSYKEIKLQDPRYPDHEGQAEFESLGVLRIYRHLSADHRRELLFYELTWSPITEPKKELIAFDQIASEGSDRAGVNAMLKNFMNSTIPDLLIYLGSKREQINTAVGQSVCWMFRDGWDSLPDRAAAYCDAARNTDLTALKNDDLFFVTHSLGSQITVDTVQRYTADMAQQEAPPGIREMNAILRNKTITVYMLANQLPLLQMAHQEPAIRGRSGDYCGKGAPLAEERVIGNLQIVAFSDPNDILSYVIPSGFAEDYIDSRACPDVSNVKLNISMVKDVFGATDFADPLQAHNGYLEDSRIIGLMTDGISRSHAAPIVRERCHWVEVVPD